MDSIRVADKAVKTPDLPLIPLVAGVSTAALVAYLLCQLPRPHSLTGREILIVATAYIVAVGLTNFVASWTIASILPDEKNLHRFRGMLTASPTVAWFPLQVLLLRQDSPWAILVVIVVATSMANVFLVSHGEVEDAAPESLCRTCQPEFLQFPDSSPLIRRLVPLLCVAVFVQVGVLALATNHLLTSTGFIGTGFFVLAWQGSKENDDGRSARNYRRSRRWLFPVLAMLLTAVVLVPYISNPQLALDLYPYLSGRALFRAFEAARRGVQVEKPNGTYSGVILWPIIKQHKKLIPPAPLRSEVVVGLHATFRKIPFNGVYWYFKTPDTRPRSDARVVHGSPMKVDVHSTDWQPILMEARQNLGTLIDVDCCSQIQVAIENGDNRPGIVALGVILTNTMAPGKPSIFLGKETVRSSHPMKFTVNRPPVSEVLDFKLPVDAKLRQFNQITVVFLPAPERALAGAKIEIQDFMLVPGGI